MIEFNKAWMEENGWKVIQHTNGDVTVQPISYDHSLSELVYELVEDKYPELGHDTSMIIVGEMVKKLQTQAIMNIATKTPRKFIDRSMAERKY